MDIYFHICKQSLDIRFVIWRIDIVYILLYFLVWKNVKNTNVYLLILFYLWEASSVMQKGKKSVSQYTEPIIKSGTLADISAVENAFGRNALTVSLR